MRTEEEIREQLKIYTEIKNRSSVFTNEFTLALGAKRALEWVLESEASDEI